MSDERLDPRVALSELRLDDLEAFGRGAALLGAGGGGDPYVGRLVLENELRSGARIRIISLDDVSDDMLVVPVLMMGAPTVMVEKVPNVDAFALALAELEKQVGRKADALIPIEIGGINSTAPLLLSARLGLPVVDADGMGRAFPEIQMVTFGIYGNPISPLLLANERGDVVHITASSNLIGERLGRALTAEMGGTSHVACYPMLGKDVKRTAVRDTLSLALEIGKAMARSRFDGVENTLFKTLANLDEPRPASILFEGKVIDVVRETKGGFNIGSVVVAGMADPDDRMKVIFQNENLIAYRNDKPVATAPDIITLVDNETAEAITTEALKFGQRVKILAIGVPGLMRTDAALEVIGPRAFGIDEDYIDFSTQLAVATCHA